MAFADANIRTEVYDYSPDQVLSQGAIYIINDGPDPLVGNWTLGFDSNFEIKIVNGATTEPWGDAFLEPNSNIDSRYEFKSKSEEDYYLGFNPDIPPLGRKEINFNADRDVEGEPFEISNVFFNDKPLEGDDGTVPPPTPINKDNLILGIYYPSWGMYEREFPVKKIPAENLTHIFYGFAKICPHPKDLYENPDWVDPNKPMNSACFNGAEEGEVDIFDWNDTQNFEELKKLKQRNPDLANILSIGGWSLSRPFSDAALTPESRKKFIDSAIQLMEKGHFDGLDIDWEYPTGGGLKECNSPDDPDYECNIYRPQDKQNYTLLLQELRAALDNKGDYLLSIAAPAGDDKMEGLELDTIHQYVDFINLMTYDYYGAFDLDATAHQAGLYNNPENPYDNAETYNIDSTVQQYLAVGVPASKLFLGLPLYGRAWSGVGSGPNSDGLFQPATGAAPGSWEPGVYDYKHLHEGAKNGVPIDISADPAEYYFDVEARVPYLYNPYTGIFSTYEDVPSIQEKVDYAQEQGLGGVFFWEITSDLPINHDDSLVHKAYELLLESR